MTTKLTEDSVALAAERYKSGDRVVSIARDLGVRENDVYAALKASNVKMRGKGRSKLFKPKKTTELKLARVVLRKASNSQDLQVLKSENKYLAEELNQANRYIAKLAMGRENNVGHKLSNGSARESVGLS